MSLVDLRNYLQQIKVGNLFQLSTYFNLDPETLRMMLAHWERKGSIRRSDKTSHCGTKCRNCNPLLTEIYEWVG